MIYTKILWLIMENVYLLLGKKNCCTASTGPSLLFGGSSGTEKVISFVTFLSLGIIPFVAIICQFFTNLCNVPLVIFYSFWSLHFKWWRIFPIVNIHFSFPIPFQFQYLFSGSDCHLFFNFFSYSYFLSILCMSIYLICSLIFYYLFQRCCCFCCSHLFLF